jgi:prevent-host-death family protein
MTSISYYEARTHFSALLDQVALGKRILITRRGRPAALLTPPPQETRKDITELIGEMKALRRGNRLGKGISIRDLIDEGRWKWRTRY